MPLSPGKLSRAAKDHIAMKEALNQRLARYAKFIEEADLVAKFYILILCLMFALHNIWAVRTIYYFILLPMFFIVVRKADLQAVVRSPIFICVAIYFATFAVTYPLAFEFQLKAYGGHLRNSLLTLAFLAMTAYLMRRDELFPNQLFLFLAVTAAAVAAATIWQFYGGLPPLDRWPARLSGIPGFTIYYNPNWNALSYGVVCVGAVAAATRLGVSRGHVALLIGSAIVLFAAVALTQSRGVLLGVLAGLAIVVLLLPKQFPSRRAIQVGLFACVAVAMVPFAAGMWERGDGYRFFLWNEYLHYVQARPWTGFGLTEELLVQTPDHAFETTHPHNMIYHALLRGGAFAAAALAALLLGTLLEAWRSWRRTLSPLVLAVAVTAILPLQVEFTVVSATSVGWDWLVLWMPIGLCLGANVARTAPERAYAL
jgi:O-antigen ligase